MFVQEYILQLQVTVHTRFTMHIGDGSNQLGEYPLDFLDGQGAMAEEIVVKFVA